MVDFNPPYNRRRPRSRSPGPCPATSPAPRRPRRRTTSSPRSCGRATTARGAQPLPRHVDGDLPRLRVHRHRVRQPRLHERDRRRPGLRAADRPDPRAPGNASPTATSTERTWIKYGAEGHTSGSRRHGGHSRRRSARREPTLGHVLAERGLLLDGDPGLRASGSAGQLEDPRMARHPAAGGRVPRRRRRALRQGVEAGARRGQGAVRDRALDRRQARSGGEGGSDVLRHAARRLGARERRGAATRSRSAARSARGEAPEQLDDRTRHRRCSSSRPGAGTTACAG